jgi:hypothetical protein
MLIRKALPIDYPGIVALQHENRPENLTDEQKRQGFVVSNMNEEQFAAINDSLGIVVAVDADRIAGFLCMVPSEVQPRHPVVQAMVDTFPVQQFRGASLAGQRVFVYGPVCIGHAWRGKGLLRRLFDAAKAIAAENYDTGAAFINVGNPHSLAAHVNGLGMSALTPFSHDGQRYDIVVFATRES